MSTPDTENWEILIENPITVCEIIWSGCQRKIDIIHYLASRGILFMTIRAALSETLL